MFRNLAAICVLTALPSVLGNPFPVVERAPQPKIHFAKHLTATGLTERAVTECQAVNAVVNALKVVSKLAYPFCSTYLHIPVITSTISSTSTVTPAVVSVTATVIPAMVTVTNQVVTTVTSTSVSSTTTIYSHYTPGAVKRAAPTLPAYLSAFGAAQVSTACSCLSIPASTTTVTTTIAKTLPTSTVTVTITNAALTTTTTVYVTSSTTTVVGSTTTIPALCAPSTLALTYDYISAQALASGRATAQPGIGDILSCCLSCFSTLNCVGYQFPSGACSLFINAGSVPRNMGSSAQATLCTLGVDESQELAFPFDGDSAVRIGPCSYNAISYF